MAKSGARILIFNVNWLGDVLFSTAAIRNIRYHFPESFIACVIPAGCAPVLEGNLRLDEVIFFDERSTHKSVWAKARFILALRKKKFTKAFLLHRSMTRALICRLAGIREIIGYATKKRAFLLTKKIPLILPDAVHRVDYYLNIVEQAGYAAKDRYTEFFFSAEDTRNAEAFLAAQGVRKSDFLVAINAGGNWGPKRWPEENWAALADALIGRCGAKVILTGGEKDRARAGAIQALMKRPLIVAAGTLSLKEFAALSTLAGCFISADTGPLHIAHAAGARNIIALFGPTAPAITGPYPPGNALVAHKSSGCKIPCYEVECADNRCMKAISVDHVLGMVNVIIQERMQ